MFKQFTCEMVLKGIVPKMKMLSSFTPTTVWFFKVIQNILFCVQHKKETNTVSERYEDE